MTILNLTQHAATSDQVLAGVTEPTDKASVQALLTFEELPSAALVAERALALAQLALVSDCQAAMIGGAPFFMGPLERALVAVGVTPFYSFTRREAAEVPDGNGGVRKTQVFRHVGFVEAVMD